MEGLDYVFRRRNVLHQQNREIWERSMAAYTGGAAYIKRALVRHVSEVELEFEERLRRAYYFNYPRRIANLITQYVLSVGPQRDHADAAICEDFSRTGMRVNEVMRQFSTLLNICGGACLVADVPFFEGELDPARQKAERLRPFVKALSLLEVADWGCAPDGRLAWLLTEEKITSDNGPFRPAFTRICRKLWTRDEVCLFGRGADGRAGLLARSRHGLGMVPAVLLFEPDGYALRSRHYFEDVVRISDAILNNESEAQMNLVKQMFGLLVISEGFARGARLNRTAAETGERFSHVLARSAAICETPEEKGISRYIAPSGAETSAIRSENTMLKHELFDVVGMGLQSQSREAQTAESKAWDHHNVRQFLAARVDLLEQAELQIWGFLHGYDSAIPVPELRYNRDFSVVDFESSVATLLKLKDLSSGPVYDQEIARAGLQLLDRIAKIAPQDHERIVAELQSRKNGGEA